MQEENKISPLEKALKFVQMEKSFDLEDESLNLESFEFYESVEYRLSEYYKTDSSFYRRSLEMLHNPSGLQFSLSLKGSYDEPVSKAEVECAYIVTKTGEKLYILDLIPEESSVITEKGKFSFDQLRKQYDSVAEFEDISRPFASATLENIKNLNEKAEGERRISKLNRFRLFNKAYVFLKNLIQRTNVFVSEIIFASLILSYKS
ncbi:MAG: hypothetical protein JNJ56_07505 [Ignavibacteria bacterium]|nr:hypothetical protein [Ignavibacteria bacterium]